MPRAETELSDRVGRHLLYVRQPRPCTSWRRFQASDDQCIQRDGWDQSVDSALSLSADVLSMSQRYHRLSASPHTPLLHTHTHTHDLWLCDWKTKPIVTQHVDSTFQTMSVIREPINAPNVVIIVNEMQLVVAVSSVLSSSGDVFSCRNSSTFDRLNDHHRSTLSSSAPRHIVTTIRYVIMSYVDIAAGSCVCSSHCRRRCCCCCCYWSWWRRLSTVTSMTYRHVWLAAVPRTRPLGQAVRRPPVQHTYSNTARVHLHRHTVLLIFNARQHSTAMQSARIWYGSSVHLLDLHDHQADTLP